MTTSLSESILAGLVAFGIGPWIIWVLVRGLRHGRLPLSGSYLVRDERPAAFMGLLIFYLCALMMTVMISFDLLVGIDMRKWL